MEAGGSARGWVTGTWHVLAACKRLALAVQGRCRTCGWSAARGLALLLVANRSSVGYAASSIFLRNSPGSGYNPSFFGKNITRS